MGFKLAWSFISVVHASLLRVASAERGIEAVLILQNDDVHRYDEVVSALNDLGLTPLHALALTQEGSDLGFGVLAKGSTAQAKAAQAFLAHATSSTSSAQDSTTTSSTAASAVDGERYRGNAGSEEERIAGDDGNGGGESEATGGMKSVVLSAAAIDAEALHTLQLMLLNQHSLLHTNFRTKTGPSGGAGGGGGGDGDSGGGQQGEYEAEEVEEEEEEAEAEEEGGGELLQCPRWALAGCCSRLPLLMHAHCPQSCVSLVLNVVAESASSFTSLPPSSYSSASASSSASSSASWLGKILSVMPGLLVQVFL